MTKGGISLNKYLKIFKAMGDKTRFRIIKMVEQKPMCVCELTAVIGLSMSTISNHLKILKEAGITTSIKENRYMNYYLNDECEFVKKVLVLLEDVRDDQILEDRKKIQKIDRNHICSCPH